MSQIPTLIDALVARLGTEDGLSEAAVTDGPLVSDSARRDWVMVGYDGDPDGEFEAAASEQDWAGMGTSREEQISLPVALIAQRGDTGVKAARDRVYAMFAAIKAVLAADPSVGLPQMQVAVVAASLHQEQTTRGIQARLVVTLAGRAFT